MPDTAERRLLRVEEEVRGVQHGQRLMAQQIESNFTELKEQLENQQQPPLHPMLWALIVLAGSTALLVLLLVIVLVAYYWL